MQPGAAPAAIDVGAIHLVPELFGLERIFADHDLGQTGRRRVRERTFDGALHGHRIRIHFADAGDAGVGFDADDQRVLAAVALPLDLGLAQVDGFNFGDFHSWKAYHGTS